MMYLANDIFMRNRNTIIIANNYGTGEQKRIVNRVIFVARSEYELFSVIVLRPRHGSYMKRELVFSRLSCPALVNKIVCEMVNFSRVS